MKNLKKLKKQFIFALLVTVLLLMILPTLSWFFYQRGLQTVTEINSASLQIWEGHYDTNGENQEYLQLNDIDVEDGTEKEYVFCVYGMEVAEYVLQLGYTTNNPFTYEIFPAEESTVSSGNAILEPNGKDYYYTKTSASALSGKYLNLSGTTASTEYHDMTFEGYDSVQTNAEPVYWQSVKITPKEAAKRSDGSFVEYYILKISWPSGSSNNKETDMIYLMTGIV